MMTQAARGYDLMINHLDQDVDLCDDHNKVFIEIVKPD